MGRLDADQIRRVLPDVRFLSSSSVLKLYVTMMGNRGLSDDTWQAGEKEFSGDFKSGIEVQL